MWVFKCHQCYSMCSNPLGHRNGAEVENNFPHIYISIYIYIYRQMISNILLGINVTSFIETIKISAGP